MFKQKENQSLIGISVLIIAISVAYYFIYALPNSKKDQLRFEQEKYQNELDNKKADDEIKRTQLELDNKNNQSDIAKKIQDDCITKTKGEVAYDFGLSNTTASPLYYPYDNELSFNKNERIVTALDAYGSCINNDPRNDGNNESIKKIITDELSAWIEIRTFMTSEKKKNPKLCSSILLSDAAKKMCESLYIEE